MKEYRDNVRNNMNKCTDNMTNEMNKITLMKGQTGKETLRLTTVAEVAQAIIDGQYLDAVRQLRSVYPLLSLLKHDDGSLMGSSPYLQGIHRVCFASALRNRYHGRHLLGYSGLVLLEVNNLKSTEEAAAIRQGCRQMPQTLLAFVGASGRSVKIVCRGELVGGGDLAALSEDEAQRFYVALYEKARMGYNAQLGVTVEKLEPRFDRVCYVSADTEAVYNPIAIPFYIDLSVPLTQNGQLPQGALPDGAGRTDDYLTMHHVVEFNLSKAYDAVAALEPEQDADYLHLLTAALADECRQTGVPISMALRMVEYRLPFRNDRRLVRLVFENAYRKAKSGSGRRPKEVRLKNVPAETLLTYKVRRFLTEHYDLRRNVMRGVAEYRLRDALGFDFEDLTAEARNSMTLRALELGITCWDKDIRRFVESDDIEPYDPISDYLERLPRWDGRDRVEPLARRVHTQYEAWPRLFHVWMRAMVAMWQGKGQLTGNALVPLLIGRQGCGKTSFCRILLPRQLREYYNDRINFRNDADLNIGLTSFALINLDEFDSVTQRQQVVLKYLVSTADLKYRPPYGKAYRQQRRYASFVGTTNEQTPLSDTSGSRRFVCVQVEGDIDFQTPIDYQQLYAQLCAEIRNGEPYWLTKDDETALMEHNRHFLRVSGLGEMLLGCYRIPAPGEQGQWRLLKDIAAHLKQVFGSGFREEPGTLEQLGAFMNRPDYRFERKRRKDGVCYLVVENG